MRDVDWVAKAKGSELAEFVDHSPRFLLVGRSLLARPRAPMQTLTDGRLLALRRYDTEVPNAASAAARLDRSPDLFVLAVQKVRSVFAHMITVGRATNNDLILPDVSVSKFHAYFRQSGEQLELVDAGSTNGTKIRGDRLRRGDHVPVQPLDVITFGSVAFHLLDAKAAWEAILGQRALG